MKKKLLIAGLLATVVMTSASALAACNNTEEHNCGHVCPTCNKCTSDCTDEACKDKCEGHEPETVDMTEGVYNCIQGGKYELLIKFYNESECYFQSEVAGYHAKYKLEDMQVTYAKTQDGGSIMDTDTHGDKAMWLTGNKVIAFYEADGTTPISYAMHKTEANEHNPTYVPAGIGYAYGTPEHVLAYDEKSDTIMSFRGEYGSRTLSHTKKNFTVNDEKAIEKAKFMVKTLPAGAEAAGKTASDYFLTLSQKGYETNIPALEALELTNGKFTQNDKVYSLTDTISGATATLTVTDTGATVKSGDTTVELVIWAEQNKPTAVLNATLKNVTAAGGATINVICSLYQDGKAVVSNDKSPTKFEGSYVVGEDSGVTFNMDEAQGVPKFANVVYNKDTKAFTGSVTMMGVTADLTGTATGELKMAAQAVATISGGLAYGHAPISITLYNNGTVKIALTGSTGVTTFEGKYIEADGSVTLTMGEDFNAVAEVTDIAVSNNTITAKGKSKQSDKADGNDLTGTVTGTLYAVKLVKATTDDNMIKLSGRDMKGSITFYTDGTVCIAVPAAKLSVTGKYTAVSGKGITVTDIGEITVSQSGLSIVIGGTASVGGKSGTISATFKCTSDELTSLLA